MRVYTAISLGICGGKFPYMQKYFFAYTEIYFRIYIMQKTKCGDFRKRIAARWENETLQKNITNYKFIG